jgi:hypothetical protein
MSIGSRRNAFEKAQRISWEFDRLLRTGGAIQSDSDRNAALSLIGVNPSASWAWTDEDLCCALRNGVVVTDLGVQILPCEGLL